MSFHPDIPNDQFRPRRTFPTNLRASISRKIRTIIGVHGAEFPDVSILSRHVRIAIIENHFQVSLPSPPSLPPPPRVIPAKFPFGRGNLIIDVILVTTPCGGCVPEKQRPTENKPSPVSPEKLHKVAIPYSKVHISIQRKIINSNRRFLLPSSANFPRANERTSCASYAITRARTRTRPPPPPPPLSRRKIPGQSWKNIETRGRVRPSSFTCGVLVVSSLLPRNEDNPLAHR